MLPFKEVVRLLDFKQRDVAAATGLPPILVRYDAKMPEVLKARIADWKVAIDLVGAFLQDGQKTPLWFQLPNPLLGGLTPRDMIRGGRLDRLLTFVKTALAENSPDQVLDAAAIESSPVRRVRGGEPHLDALLKAQRGLLSELALYPEQIEPKLHAALRKGCAPFAFTNWKRAVKSRFSRHPFSKTPGLLEPAGRFNYGGSLPARFVPFPALYMAKDADTALQEELGHVAPPAESRLKAHEIALADPKRETISKVRGDLERVLDLRSPGVLEPFLDVLTSSRAPGNVRATRLGGRRRIARTTAELVDSLLMPEWRFFPVQCDIPSPSQLFGHLALAAGVQGIVYRSRLTGKNCVATFPFRLA